MTPRQRFGRFLASARKRAGMSQADLARDLGYTSAQFPSNWERGISLPPMDRLRDVAHLLQIKSSILAQCERLCIEEAKERFAEMAKALGRGRKET